MPYRPDWTHSSHRCMCYFQKGFRPIRMRSCSATQLESCKNTSKPQECFAAHRCGRPLSTLWHGSCFRRPPHAFLGQAHHGADWSAHLVPSAFSWEIPGCLPFTWLATTWHTVGVICWVSNEYLLRSIWSFPVILEYIWWWGWEDSCWDDSIDH